jgi:hypothetical protein
MPVLEAQVLSDRAMYMQLVKASLCSSAPLDTTPVSEHDTAAAAMTNNNTNLATAQATQQALQSAAEQLAAGSCSVPSVGKSQETGLIVHPWV